MGYKSEMSRREFGKKLFYGLAGAAVSLYLPKSLHADDKVENEEAISIFGKIWEENKGRGDNFEYVERIHVDDDNVLDTVKFILESGKTISHKEEGEEYKTYSGKLFKMEINLSSKSFPPEIYGIISDTGRISIVKSKWVNDDDVKKYLDNIYKHKKEGG